MIVRTDSKGWDVGCNVALIVLDMERYCGMLSVPINNSPDMRKTIECFRSVYPEILRIEVEVDGVLDIVYDREHTPHWVSLRVVETFDE
jgi:hypothetical protein